MTCTNLISVTVILQVTSFAILKGRIHENGRTYSIQALLILVTDTRSRIAAGLIVEVYLAYVVCARKARTIIIMIFSVVFVETTNIDGGKLIST